MATTQSGIVLRHLRQLVRANDAGALPDQHLLDRFVRGREEAAFTALVRRHGPLVLGVCRRVLHQEQDAEDVFQATFLVLARKAGAIGNRASVGSWLYRVAYHMALKARKQAATRHKREARAARPDEADPLAEVTGRELLAVLDAELDELPQSRREPLVLCYLQGLTRDEAARQLGCSESTLKRRLEAGKEDLRRRLARRGLALPAVLTAAGVVGSAVPATLAATTARAAIGRAALVSARVAALAHGSLRAMSAGPAKAVGAAFFAILLVGAGLLDYGSAANPARTADDDPPQAPTAAAKEPTPRAADAKRADEDPYETPIRGRVLDPDGKPAVGARVYLFPADRKSQAAPQVRAVTDKDGRFSFAAPREGGQLFVTAADCGPAWVLKPGRLEDSDLRLARDDVPVVGRVLDLQGQPVAGAKVRVHSLKAPPEGTLDRWLEAVKVSRDGLAVESEHLPHFAHPALAQFFPPVTTDRDGRFQIKGVGRERAVALIVEGPSIETQEINVLTRPGAPVIRLPWYSDSPFEELLIYHPPTFSHAAAPCRVVSGVVRDRETGKAIPGAVVRALDFVGNPVYFVETTSDKDGRFRLTGLRRKSRLGRENALVALPPAGEPFLSVSRPLAEETQAKAGNFDFDLPRGVWLEGQVKDKATGRGVEARLGYYVFNGSPDDAEVRRLYIPPVFGLSYSTDRDGKFRIVAAPYRGLIGARAKGETKDRYRIGAGAEQIKGRVEGGTLFDTYPHQADPDEFDAVAEINPKKGATAVSCDLVLDPGRTVAVQVRGPDGKPLEGARAHGRLARGGWEHDLLPAEFRMYGVDPDRGRTLLLQHLGKNLTARVEIKGDERGPVVVTLRPGAAVVGRILDDRGRPLRRAGITVDFRPAKGGLLHLHSREFRTDAEGRFRIDGLLPELTWSADVLPPEGGYRRLIFKDLSLKGGETKDLGDVKLAKGDE
jgi:RNA polymerase sigma factor (sigma-70 family)